MKTVRQNIDQLADQFVIVRANFDVPLGNGRVGDDTRILDCLPTIKLLLEQNCQLVIIAHQDRPGGKFNQDNSLQPITKLLTDVLSTQINFVPFTPDISHVDLDPTSPINLLDNLRFWPGETSNDSQFTKSLAQFGHFYVNEAFANCHRQHASITSLSKILPSYAGLLLEKEIQVLDQVSQNPNRPLVVVIGGAKIETKEPLVNTFVEKADNILVGGKIAGDLAIKAPPPPNVKLASLTQDGKDITIESAQEFAQIINSAGTVIWNGTMGLFEDKAYKTGTQIVATAINNTSAYTLVGGGDTEAALTELYNESNINHISSGGGAMLTYLSTGNLVGLEPLMESDGK